MSPGVACVVLLPIKDNLEDNIECWTYIVDACLLGMPGVPVSEPLQSKSPTPGKQNGAERKGGRGRGRTASKVEVDDLGGGSDGKVVYEAGRRPTQPMKLVGCRYVVCGDSVVDEWARWRPVWNDAEDVRREEEICEAVSFMLEIAGESLKRWVDTYVFCVANRCGTLHV